MNHKTIIFMIIPKLYSNVVDTYLASSPVILLNFASSLEESDPLPDSTDMGPRDYGLIQLLQKRRKKEDWLTRIILCVFMLCQFYLVNFKKMLMTILEIWFSRPLGVLSSKHHNEQNWKI